jgi:hypothetical protein
VVNDNQIATQLILANEALRALPALTHN